MSESSNRTSFFERRPLHITRAVAAFSSIIVTGILAYFCYHLRNDGFKLPWTFLIVILASFFTVVTLAFTSIINCCGTLSPLLDLIINLPLLGIWVIGFSILAWNMLGTLRHSCSLENWGVDDGVSVCRTYKTLFSFVFIGLLTQFGMVGLDVKARRKQVRSGKYDKMDDSTNEVKLQPINVQQNDKKDVFVDTHEIRDDGPGWRPGTSSGREPTGYHGHATQIDHGYHSNPNPIQNYGPPVHYQEYDDRNYYANNDRYRMY